MRLKNLFLLCSMSLVFAACSNTENKSETATNEEVIVPKPIKVETQEISYEVDGKTFKGFYAFDANKEGRRPGVIVVHEWWGHNDHARRSAIKLAELGYAAFALDMYGEGKTAEHPEDAMKFSGEVFQNFEAAKERFNAAVATMNEQPQVDANKTAAIGYCFGGGIVLNMVRQGFDLDAVASFHGSLDPVMAAEPEKVKAKILVMNGEADPFVKPEAIDAFKQEMSNAGVTMEFVNYPGAVHGFTNPEATELGQKFNLPLAYNQEADTNSWNKMASFFASVFKQ